MPALARTRNHSMNQLLAMRVFIRLVETQSFSRTADQLDLPKSSVSKLISDLEEHLGTKLVQRTTRRINITEEGATYHEYATRLLADLAHADEAVRKHRLRPHGRLRVDVPTTVAHRLLIPRLAAFSAEYPDITVALGVGDRQVNVVGEGVDCVIRGGDLGEPALVARKLLELEYGTYASPGYIARHGNPETPGCLRRGHSVVAYFSPNIERMSPLLFENGQERWEIDNARFSANDGEAQVGMIRAGLGIGQHFRSLVQPLVEAGELVPVLPQWTRPPFPLHVVYPPGKFRSTRVAVFVDWLLRNFSGNA